MNGTSAHFQPTDDDKASQRRLVLTELRQGPRSTHDLRRQGLIIDTLRVRRCAVYALREVVA